MCQSWAQCAKIGKPQNWLRGSFWFPVKGANPNCGGGGGENPDAIQTPKSMTIPTNPKSNLKSHHETSTCPIHSPVGICTACYGDLFCEYDLSLLASIFSRTTFAICMVWGGGETIVVFFGSCKGYQLGNKHPCGEHLVA